MKLKDVELILRRSNIIIISISLKESKLVNKE